MRRTPSRLTLLAAAAAALLAVAVPRHAWAQG